MVWNHNSTFLVAEQDASLRRIVSQYICDMGYPSVVEAENGTAAWAHLRKNGADMVIAGWNMPEMTGLALLKIMRAEVKFQSTPFILHAEEITRAQVVEAGDAGVSDIILRPFTQSVFQRKVEVFFQPERDPQHLAAEASYQEGCSLMNHGRWDEAIRSFDKILTIYENAELYYNMGFIKTAQGLYEEAIRYFRRATQINNAFARAYQKLAECYIQLGRQEEAQRCLEKAAEIYMEKHMDDNAEQVLKEVIKLNPNTLNVYNSLGIIYRRQGKHGKAVIQYERALKVSPGDEHIHFNLARAHMEMEQFTKAREVLRAALSINPQSVETASMLRYVESRLPAKLR